MATEHWKIKRTPDTQFTYWKTFRHVWKFLLMWVYFFQLYILRALNTRSASSIQIEMCYKMFNRTFALAIPLPGKLFPQMSAWLNLSVYLQICAQVVQLQGDLPWLPYLILQIMHLHFSSYFIILLSQFHFTLLFHFFIALSTI